MSAVSLFDSVCLLIVTVSAVLHLNSMHRGYWWDRLSFALVAGGAFGLACEWWWPRLTMDQWARLTFHGGCAMVGFSMVVGHLKELFRADHPRLHRAILELAAIANTPAQFHQVQRAAAAALAMEGIDRRAQAPVETSDDFIDRRFGQGS